MTRAGKNLEKSRERRKESKKFHVIRLWYSFEDHCFGGQVLQNVQKHLRQFNISRYEYETRSERGRKHILQYGLEPHTDKNIAEAKRIADNLKKQQCME